MKNLMSALVIFAMGVLVAWAFFSATAEVQAVRESECDQQLAACTTGQHCIVKGHEIVTITSRGAK